MAKYFYSFIIILYFFSFTKEKKTLDSEQWLEIDDYNFIWKSTKNIMNLSYKIGNISFLFERKSKEIKDGLIWNSFNFSKKKHIKISFNLSLMSSEKNPLKLKIIFVSSSIEKLNKGKILRNRNSNSISFDFNIINNPLKYHGTLIFSIQYNMKGINYEILSKAIAIKDIFKSNTNFLIEINNKKLLIKTEENKILVNDEELIELEQFLNKEHIYLCFASLINQNFFIKNLKISTMKENHKYKIKKQIFNEMDYKKKILNHHNLRQLQGDNYISIIINGPKENVNVVNDTFSQLPQHIFLDGNDLGNSTSITLEKEGPNEIILSWDKTIDTTYNLFFNCKDIISIDLSNFDSSKITTMNSMFSGCTSLVSVNFENFNTSSSKNMINMFKNCQSLNSLDLSNFVTGQAINLNGMFMGCNSIETLDLSKFDTSSVTNMNSLFKDCSSLKYLNISIFDTSLVTNMGSMFKSCSSLHYLNVSKFNTSSVTNMENIFSSCSSLTSLEISNFDTSSVTTMKDMFSDCSSLLSLDLLNFNTLKVKNMKNMFNKCSSLVSLDLSKFDTYLVNNMANMFSDCNSLQTLNIQNFNTGSILDLNSMFNNCKSLISIDISKFDLSSVTNMNAMFRNCSCLQNLVLPNSNTKSLTNMNEIFNGCISLTSLDLTHFDTSLVTNMRMMFKNCSTLSSLDFSSFNVSNVVNMEYMFYAASTLESLDLSNFYTSSLKIMKQMFNGCKSLKYLDISNFNTSSIQSLEYIFKDCVSLTSLNLSSFNTSNTTAMNGIFHSCSSLVSLDLSNYNTSSVKTMKQMFTNCSSLKFVNLSNFIISSKTDTKFIFYNCTSLERLDLSNFYSYYDIQGFFTNFSKIDIINRTLLPKNEVEKINNDDIIISDTTMTKNEMKNNLDDIIINNTTMSKNEMANNLDDIIKEKDLNKAHIIEGEDYLVYIKSIDKYIESSSININFSDCEKILNINYPNNNFTVAQINMKNNNKKYLVDQVQYKIYNNEKNPIDLSICKNKKIKIEFKVTKKSEINIEQIRYFQEKNVDIFNINDSFFNDICYSYSDSDSNSDMILSDRINDIYQNVTICGSGCIYESFDADKISSNCICDIQNEIYLKIDESSLEKSVESAFLDSNFGVIKCYNLVFSFKGKLKNAGFWIFAIIIIFHFPTNIINFINGLNPIKSYIKNEMNSKGYIIENKKISETKENIINAKEISSNPPKIYNKAHYIFKYKQKNFNTKDKITFFEYNDMNIKVNAPPKKDSKGVIIKFGDSKKDLNTIVPESFHNSQIISEKEEKIDENKIKNIIDDDKNDINPDVINVETIENIEKKRKVRSKTFRRSVDIRNNNLITKSDLDELIIDSKAKKLIKKRKKKKLKTASTRITKTSDKQLFEINENKNVNKINTDFPLILINANNEKNPEIFKSNYILNNYEYNEAIQYDNRSIFRIFFIYLIMKDNVLNIILFNPPLELRPLRICIFIFSYACDLALNALFYLSDNISDKYHYSGANRLLFSLINNITISLASTIVSFILLTFFQTLIQSSDSIIELFRNQEKLLKSNKDYKVDIKTKEKIEKDLSGILKCLKVKIIIFVIFEFLFTLFFFYYVTAFCQVYQSTQISWLLDSISSYVISFGITLIISFIFSILYKLSIIYQVKILFSICQFMYS